MALIDLKHIYFQYKGNSDYCLKDISFYAHHGEHIAICGENGCGKSTLSLLIGGLRSPDYGYVEMFDMKCFDKPFDENNGTNCKNYINGDNYKRARQRIGFVFQNVQSQLICFDVVSELAFTPQNLNWNINKINESINYELEKAGLEHLAMRDPKTLSGGEQQLVCIAAALASNPEILILDEPTTYLDGNNQKKFMKLIQNIRKLTTTLIHITHVREEMKIADRIFWVN